MNRANNLFPLFLELTGRKVVVVGGGAMAAVRVAQLAGTGARVTVVAPAVRAEILGFGVTIVERAFVSADLDGAWLVVAAATPEVNRQVAREAEARRLFVNAVDDPEAASAYSAAVVRRAGVAVAVSTEGSAPALAGLLREGLDALLPADLAMWCGEAERLRSRWRQERVPLARRRPALLVALNRLYDPDHSAQSAGEEGNA